MSTAQSQLVSEYVPHDGNTIIETFIQSASVDNLNRPKSTIKLHSNVNNVISACMRAFKINSLSAILS